MSNTIGLVPGSVAGALGYRRELAGRARMLTRLAAASLAGGIAGAVLLLALPPGAFKAVVPAFIALALLLVVAQPRLVRALAARREERHPHGGAWTLAALAATGIYGGYFGAAQGIMLLGILGVLLDDTLQRANGIKNVLAGLTNLVAGVVFAFSTHVDWTVALLIACGSLVGGFLGAHLGRRLPDPVLRLVIVAVGTFAIVKLVA